MRARGRVSMLGSAMTSTSAVAFPERARPGSLVARADGRHRTAVGLLAAMPLLVALCLPIGLALAAVCCFVAFSLTLFDLVDWMDAARAARRMKRGDAPLYADVDFGLGEDCWTRDVPASAPYRDVGHAVLLARGCPVTARRAIGGNLLRRGMWTALCTWLCVSLVQLLGVPAHPAHASSAKTQLSTLRQAGLLYVAAHPDACPSIDDLRAGGYVDRSLSSRDPWGNGCKITCTDEDVIVSSFGPDRTEGTEDDVAVPPR
jgi:hypothetical protein